MQIDRSKFISLVSALAVSAAVGCTITTVKNTPPASDDGGVVSGNDSGTGTDGSVSTGSDGGATSDAPVTAACLGKLALPAPDCEALANDPAASACYTTGMGQAACFLSTGLKTEIAVDLVKCVSGLTTCPSGDPALNACVNASVAKACVDPAMEKPCQDELDRCATNGITPDISKAQCVKVLSALLPTGVSDFKDCTTMRAGGCTLDSKQYQCLDEYKSGIAQ
jgi:hypothetical protein